MSALVVIAAYLVGSISFPWLIGRAKGIDLRRAGSRKLGGSNLMRQAGVGWGAAGGVLDGFKGVGTILAARALGLDETVQIAAGLAAVCGQLWPVFFGFDGGRANATGWGLCLSADPAAALVMAIPIVFAVLLRGVVPSHPTRVIPVGALASFAVWPAVIWEQEGATVAVAGGLALLGLIVIRRLTAGLRLDLAIDAPLGRVILRRLFFDRSELQSRGMVAIS